MDKSRLLDIFKNLDKEESGGAPYPTLNLHSNSRVLLIDSLNLFLRNFCALNHFNRAGNHVGGLTGTLKSLGSLIKTLNPTKIIMCFDGERGSVARKYLYRPYKANRSATKITNTRSFSTAEEEKSAKNDQITRLVDYLRTLPVQLIVCDNLEADDIIAHLATYIPENYPDSLTYIVSSDQDYLQRVNDRVFVYSPIKHILYDTKTVLEEYGIHPFNLNVYKSLIGDTSDNLPGVSGIGQKNIQKLFPDLIEPKFKGLEYIYETCELKPTKSVLYDRILYVRSTLETMFKLMDLHSPNISDGDKEEIERVFKQKTKPFDKIEVHVDAAREFRNRAGIGVVKPARSAIERHVE